MTYEEQLEMLDAALNEDPSGRAQQVRVREYAVEAVEHPESYTANGFHMVVRKTGNHGIHCFSNENDAWPVPHASYSEVVVTLHPALEPYPGLAQLVAEKQLESQWPR